MKSLLDALQEGRLVELPDNEKTDALEILAALIEAIPEVQVEDEVTEKVIAREQLHNTGIGKGWACPHANSSRDGELVCSVGWSPHGIDYGSPDEKPVHLIVMYFVPDSQKNSYLKEISSLAKAIEESSTLQQLQNFTELAEVRNNLLDAISHALEWIGPDARARMIQLEVKHAASEAASKATPQHEEASASPCLQMQGLLHHLTDLTIITVPEKGSYIFTQNAPVIAEMEQLLENQPHVLEQLKVGSTTTTSIGILLCRSREYFVGGRSITHCLLVQENRSIGR